MKAIKRYAKSTIASSPFMLNLIEAVVEDFPKIFLYHRFCDSYDTSSNKVNVDTFRWQLSKIKNQYHVISFGDCIRYFYSNGKWPKKCVVVTVDDGYRDFYRLAYPELKRLKMSATLFVTVNFVNRYIWLWPDRLHFAIQNTNKSKLHIIISGQNESFDLGCVKEKFNTWKYLSDYCISLPDREKEAIIAMVESELCKYVPSLPTPDYESVTWEEVAEMQANGIEIGSHTMNHPILSKITADRLRMELITSRAILENRLLTPVRSFCYPNGQPGDINDEVIDEVRNAGYLGAPYWFDLTTWDPFLLPRMGVSNDKHDFLAKLGGLEMAGHRLRKKVWRNV